MSATAGPKMDAANPRPNGPLAPPPAPGAPPLAEEAAQGDPLASLTDVSQMWLKFGKTFLVILPIYVLGYLEFSFSWVLVGLAAMFYWKRNHGEQDNRINRALRFLDHEEGVTKRNAATTQLPPWVQYPDVERVEWLNKTVKQMWPFICQFVDKLFRETIEPSVQSASPYLSSFCFSKIDLGDKPLRVNGVKVYTENVDKRQVIMDLEVSFVGNTEIDIDVKKFYCRAGIKNIQLHGVMRVVMEPLLGDMPLIGAVSVFFLKKPWLDINWTGLTNMLDIPGVNGLTDGLIQDILCQFLVLPNKIRIPLVGDAQLAQLRFPVPKGVLRIHFLEAQELLGKDKFLGGLIKGKSDPYGVIQVGTELFQSKVIHETVNPKWNEVYEALVYDSGTVKTVGLELFDEDPDKDDFLGSLTIDLAEVQKEQKVDEWFSLEDVSQGKIHLKLEWLSLRSDPDKLHTVLSSVQAERGRANDGLSAALLVVFLDSAHNLPSVFEASLGPGAQVDRSRVSGFVFCENTSSLFRSLFTGKKVNSDPSPFVKFTVGHKSFESQRRYKTNQPVWEEAFTFLIHNPTTQELEVEVEDEKHECTLGTLTVPLTSLLEAKDMTLNKSFILRSSGPTCSLKMKMALWVLCLESDAPLSSDPSSVQVRKSSSSSTPRPSISSDSGLKTPSQPRTHRSASVSAQEQTLHNQNGGLEQRSFTQSSLTISGSQQQLAGGKEPTPSIASDISNPYATQELQYRLSQIHNGSGTSHFPLGEIQLTIRHSSQRNRLIVVVHCCRNLIAFTEHGSDPYVRLYLLPDKRRSGRRKTSTFKKTLNPMFDQIFEFNVSVVELHRRTLDVAVKNGGGLLSKHKGLLGKVLVDLTHDDIAKGWTQWFELSSDGARKPPLS
ncbi:extended synaptotagmin-2-like isoform X2 [Eucyclogobius newberryi]|uniref:extended synaptotagmin-2-like isoform X2 n=1 Tax=Eucyclogobius newberryi TaxID=166745 RepID=UPI003B5AB715